MPRPLKTSTHESFRFAVDEWTFHYGMHVNSNYRPGDPVGLCWENQNVVIAGKLRSKTKRRCDRVTLNLCPAAVEPEEWKPEWKGFGRVVGVRNGALTARARLPSLSFQRLLTALAAGKVHGAFMSVDDVVRGRGVITSFSTTNPDEADD
jgi:hypothetical protein